MNKSFLESSIAQIKNFKKIFEQQNDLKDEFFQENLYGPKWQQQLQITKKLYETQSEFQKILIFENPIFGKVLALDGILQTTENDEFIYHEMLSHVPMFSHGKVKKILIIGGGDGGMLREVLRNKEIEKAVMVEIDGLVVDACKKYMPSLFDGSDKDKRAEIIIGDGIEYVKNTKEKFDLIIVDSTDPVGPGIVLFTKEFYSYCKNSLNENGILVTQNGVPFSQKKELVETFENRRTFFKDNRYFIAPVFGYIGGFMAFGWATDNFEYHNKQIEDIEKAASRFSGEMKYYNPQIHKASFCLPNYILNKLK